MEKVLIESEDHFFSGKRNFSEIKGKVFVGITQLAVILIVAILVVVLGIIIYEGRSKFSWEFISTFPTNGMTEGGIFPALLDLHDLDHLELIAAEVLPHV